MADTPTRDECVRTVMTALDELEKADVEALFDQATVAIDALVDAVLLIPAERFDEDCHTCERLMRDHFVDGRCPTIVDDARSVHALGTIEHRWQPEEPDPIGRVRRCWADRCERPAAWEVICPGGVTVHEHYCEGHAIERGRPNPYVPASPGRTVTGG